MATSPTVRTGPASALGAKAMTVNGVIHPHGLHTTYRVEYVPRFPYPHATQDVALPPRLGAYYEETWEDSFAGWSNSFGCGIEQRSDGKASPGYVRYTEQPLINDFNHEATGVLHLMTGFYAGKGEVGGGAQVALGGGDPDLRGARLSMWVRGTDWQPNGSEFICWVQSQSNPKVGNNPGWRRANWGYNGHYLTDYLLDGQWHKVELTLANDSDLWSYGGNNQVQQQESAARYEYWSIDSTLRHNNINFLLLSAYVDPQDPPAGSIDFDEFQMTYRNWSLVFPGNGGELADWPKDSRDDPATLTDGWRNGEGRAWRSAENPNAPQEFVYSFSDPVTIETVQLHNNPDWPGKDVELLASVDGRSYELIGRSVVPEKGELGDNFAFGLIDGLSGRSPVPESQADLRVQRPALGSWRDRGVRQRRQDAHRGRALPSQHRPARLEARPDIPLPPGCYQRRRDQLRGREGIHSPGDSAASGPDRAGVACHGDHRQGGGQAEPDGGAHSLFLPARYRRRLLRHGLQQLHERHRSGAPSPYAAED